MLLLQYLLLDEIREIGNAALIYLLPGITLTNGYYERERKRAHTINLIQLELIRFNCINPPSGRPQDLLLRRSKGFALPLSKWFIAVLTRSTA